MTRRETRKLAGKWVESEVDAGEIVKIADNVDANFASPAVVYWEPEACKQRVNTAARARKARQRKKTTRAADGGST